MAGMVSSWVIGASAFQVVKACVRVAWQPQA